LKKGTVLFLRGRSNLEFGDFKLRSRILLVGIFCAAAVGGVASFFLFVTYGRFVILGRADFFQMTRFWFLTFEWCVDSIIIRHHASGANKFMAVVVFRLQNVLVFKKTRYSRRSIHRHDVFLVLGRVFGFVLAIVVLSIQSCPCRWSQSNGLENVCPSGNANHR